MGVFISIFFEMTLAYLFPKQVSLSFLNSYPPKDPPINSRYDSQKFALVHIQYFHVQNRSQGNLTGYNPALYFEDY